MTILDWLGLTLHMVTSLAQPNFNHGGSRTYQIQTMNPRVVKLG
jgi:cAMP phosphodiesterase